MAVYTKVTEQQIQKLLSTYNIGKFKQYQGIIEGVENTNYLLFTESGKFILTIYEKRVKEKDLPFYMSLMTHLHNNKIPTPLPIQDKNKKIINRISGKPSTIVTFLDGKSTKNCHNTHLRQLGTYTAKIHVASSSFNKTLNNNFSITSWKKLFNKVKNQCDNISPGMTDEIATSLAWLERKWPNNLPKGIIHGDLFPDNVFFTNGNLSGIIDFYFACEDFFLYEIAIILNAWCFENGHDFNITKARTFLSSYNKIRTIKKEEINALPIIASGAAIRFLLTRIHDLLNTVEGALVTPKEPKEYLQRLRFHREIKSANEYGI